jgi:hypothetical protein
MKILRLVVRLGLSFAVLAGLIVGVRVASRVARSDRHGDVVAATRDEVSALWAATTAVPDTVSQLVMNVCRNLTMLKNATQDASSNAAAFSHAAQQEAALADQASASERTNHGE